MVRLFALILVVSTSLFAQSPSDFVLDKSKPYAYLNFDHIGPRKPAEVGESKTGIWLRIVNNCRIPIVLRSSSAPEGETGLIFEDEVLPEEPMLEIVLGPLGPLNPEQKLRSREEGLKHMPNGYQFEVSGAVKIEPGKDALFSIPADHISPNWYIRVKFALAIDRSSVSTGPFTYLEFHDYDIPKGAKTAQVP